MLFSQKHQTVDKEDRKITSQWFPTQWAKSSLKECIFVNSAFKNGYVIDGVFMMNQLIVIPQSFEKTFESRQPQWRW